MAHEDIEVVQRLVDAFNSGDIDGILALTHPDFEVEVPPELSAEPDVYIGHAGMRRYWESFHDALDEVRFDLEEYWELDGAVVVALRVSAKGRRTAIAIEQRNAGVWRTRDRKALQANIFASLADALHSVGLSEQA
jgi:ketosteroid isomerase-like protein